MVRKEGKIKESLTSSPNFLSIFSPYLLLSVSSPGHELKRNSEYELVPGASPHPYFFSPVFLCTHILSISWGLRQAEYNSILTYYYFKITQYIHPL